MAEPKTKPTDASVADYLAALPDARVRADCERLLALMARASGARPVMWGTSIVGFGAYRYTYASGTTGDWPLTGFAPRARDITVYLMDGFDQRKAELGRLGPHTHSKSCLYLKSLDGIDLRVLESMVADSVKAMRARWPAGSVAPAAAAASTRKPAAKKATAKKVATKNVATKKAVKKAAGKAPTAKQATRPKTVAKSKARR